MTQSNRLFLFGLNTLETVETYKYLGVIFHFTGDFSANCDVLSKAAGIAFGNHLEFTKTGALLRQCFKY
jgi:hypothetical protein